MFYSSLSTQAHFLRTSLPDVDLASELLRDEITTDARITHKLKEFDPYVGNLLGTVWCSYASAKTAFLVFPMGELNRDLSAFHWSICAH